MAKTASVGTSYKLLGDSSPEDPTIFEMAIDSPDTYFFELHGDFEYEYGTSVACEEDHAVVAYAVNYGHPAGDRALVVQNWGLDKSTPSAPVLTQNQAVTASKPNGLDYNDSNGAQNGIVKIGTNYFLYSGIAWDLTDTGNNQAGALIKTTATTVSVVDQKFAGVYGTDYGNIYYYGAVAGMDGVGVAVNLVENGSSENKLGVSRFTNTGDTLNTYFQMIDLVDETGSVIDYQAHNLTVALFDDAGTETLHLGYRIVDTVADTEEYFIKAFYWTGSAYAAKGGTTPAYRVYNYSDANAGWNGDSSLENNSKVGLVALTGHELFLSTTYKGTSENVRNAVLSYDGPNSDSYSAVVAVANEPGNTIQLGGAVGPSQESAFMVYVDDAPAGSSELYIKRYAGGSYTYTDKLTSGYYQYIQNFPPTPGNTLSFFGDTGWAALLFWENNGNDDEWSLHLLHEDIPTFDVSLTDTFRLSKMKAWEGYRKMV